MGTHRVNLWTQRNHPPTPLPRKGKVAHKQLMMVHFAMLCKASPCGCHLFKKEDLHKSKVVGWHDDGIDSKSNELTGPIMNVWSNVHVITHPHTYIHMLIGCRNFPSDVIKVSKRKSLWILASFSHSPRFPLHHSSSTRKHLTSWTPSGISIWRWSHKGPFAWPWPATMQHPSTSPPFFCTYCKNSLSETKFYASNKKQEKKVTWNLEKKRKNLKLVLLLVSIKSFCSSCLWGPWLYCSLPAFFTLYRDITRLLFKRLSRIRAA